MVERSRPTDADHDQPVRSGPGDDISARASPDPPRPL